MKKYLIHLVLFVFFLGISLSCNDLADELQDFYDQAPGFCKEMCSEEYDCEKDSFSEYVSGEYWEDAHSDWERNCVMECALPCAEGVYIVEPTAFSDSGHPTEFEYNDYVSAGAYQDFANCVWTLDSEYYECNYHCWQLLDMDENYCVELNECIQKLGLDWSSEWTMCQDEYDTWPCCQWDKNDQYFEYELLHYID